MDTLWHERTAQTICHPVRDVEHSNYTFSHSAIISTHDSVGGNRVFCCCFHIVTSQSLWLRKRRLSIMHKHIWRKQLCRVHAKLSTTGNARTHKPIESKCLLIMPFKLCTGKHSPPAICELVWKPVPRSKSNGPNYTHCSPVPSVLLRVSEALSPYNLHMTCSFTCLCFEYYHIAGLLLTMEMKNVYSKCNLIRLNGPLMD